MCLWGSQVKFTELNDKTSLNGRFLHNETLQLLVLRQISASNSVRLIDDVNEMFESSYIFVQI